MRLFDKKRKNTKNKQNQTLKKIGLSELNDNVLSNIAGGQSYYDEQSEQANIDLVRQITQSQ